MVTSVTGSADAVVESFEADDVAGVLALLPTLSDETRSRAWERLRRELCSIEVPDGYAASTVDAKKRRALTRAVTALAVGPADVVHQVGGRVLPPESASLVDQVLLSRSAAWLEGFTTSTLHAFASEPEVGLIGPAWWNRWQQIRARERSGLLHPDPTSDDYLVVMVRGLMFSGSIVDGVHADPALAELSVWSLFEPAPAVQKALLGSERFWDANNTWRVALVRLALDGLLDRRRLTDAATTAAGDVRMGRAHRAWYRRIPDLIARPAFLPEPSDLGAPPPGNRLRQRG